MDQGSTIHDSNQSNLLTLLGNFGPQGDFSRSLESDKQSIVVTTDTSEQPVAVHNYLEVLIQCYMILICAITSPVWLKFTIG